MKKVLVIAVVAVLAAAAFGAWRTPVNLGSRINTSSHDGNPTLTTDNKLIVFHSRRSGGYGADDLWRSRWASGSWQTPQNLGTRVNTSATEATAFIARNNTRLYFSSNTSGGYGGQDIYWCTFSNGVPGTKTNVGSRINSSRNEIYPVLTRDENTIYFASTRLPNYGQHDIWVSAKSGGNWQTPVNLGNVINTTGQDYPMWISDNGNILVISSNRSGTRGGYDFWYSVKSGGSWRAPVNFGSTINTTRNDIGCAFTCNHGGIGGYMYFSTYDRPGGRGGKDIWRSTDSRYTPASPTSLGRVKALFR